MKKVTFQNRKSHELSGVLHTPDKGPTKAFAVFAHCFTCTGNIRAAAQIARALSELGIAVLRFDFTGLGASEGDFADTHFSSDVDDLIDAAGFLANNYSAPKIIIGHSLGGTAALAAAHHIPSLRAVATIGSPADAEHVLHLLGDDVGRIESKGIAEVKLAGRPFTIRKEFIDNLRSQNVSERLGALRKPLLVMHSPLDNTVGIEQAAIIFQAAKHPKSFVSLEDADHLLTRNRDSRYAAQVLAAWASRFIDQPETEHAFPATRADRVVVQNRSDDGFFSTINARGHQLLADEPVEYGGGNEGPTPYDLLGAALGTCTAMTLNMYARRKELPVSNVVVSTRHEKIHARECEDCETQKGKIDRFEREIRIEGDLTEQQRQRMLEIADMCPVHRSLHAEVEIVSRLKQSR